MPLQVIRNTSIIVKLKLHFGHKIKCIQCSVCTIHHPSMQYAWFAFPMVFHYQSDRTVKMKDIFTNKIGSKVNKITRYISEAITKQCLLH